MRKQKYTLIEILSVVIIIGIIALIIIQVSGHVSDRNRRIRTEAIIKQLQLALEDCKAKYGYYKVNNVSEFSAGARLPYNLIMNCYISSSNAVDDNDDGNITTADRISAPTDVFQLNPRDPSNRSQYLHNAASRYRKDFLKTCDLTKLPTKNIGGTYYIVDGWGEPIQYFTDANGSRYTLYSYGKYQVQYSGTNTPTSTEQEIIFGRASDDEEKGTVIRAE